MTPETKEELVEAAVDALSELTPAQLLSAVGIKSIAASVGVAPPTVYHHFGSLEGFADAVVDRIYDTERFPTVEITDRIVSVLQSQLPVEMGLTTHTQEFHRLRNDEEMRTRVGLWALGGAEMDERYATFVRAIDARITGYMEAVFAAWGRELREPFDIESFVAVELALLSGSVIRNTVDPEVMDADKFARVALSLLSVALRLPNDRRTLDDRLTEINYYPLRQEHRSTLSPLQRETRARILDAASELFGRVYARDDSDARVTVAQIARTANVGTSTIYKLFEGVEDIAVQLFIHQARDVLGSSTLR